MNNVTLIGRLTKDIEVRTIQSGLKVTDFTIAIHRIGNSEKTDFVRCTAWRQSAEYLEKYAQKGFRIAVVGSINVEQWEDEDGDYHEMTKVSCSNVSILDYAAESKDSGKSNYKKSRK